MTAPANVFARADTMTGTCQAIGEDFGFHPNILRVMFALGLFWSAEWTAVTYLTLAAAVLASRLIFPARRRAVVATAQVPAEVAGDNDAGAIAFAKAA